MGVGGGGGKGSKMKRGVESSAVRLRGVKSCFFLLGPPFSHSSAGLGVSSEELSLLVRTAASYCSPLVTVY